MVLTSVTPRQPTLSASSTVRAQVTGVPAGTSDVRVRLGGADAGMGLTQVHFTAGDDGADGEGPIDCYTSNSTGRAVLDGLYATCTSVRTDADGSFFVDMKAVAPARPQQQHDVDRHPRRRREGRPRRQQLTRSFTLR